MNRFGGVVTSDPAIAIRDNLLHYMDEDDRLLVLKSGVKRRGGASFAIRMAEEEPVMPTGDWQPYDKSIRKRTGAVDSLTCYEITEDELSALVRGSARPLPAGVGQVSCAAF